MKVVVIEDNAKAKRLILAILSQIDGVDIVGESSSVKKGTELIKLEQPDLAILDVELEDGVSFDILKNIDTTNLQIIFTTSFEEYAIDAFKYSAINYLIKPIDVEVFIETIEKAKNTLSIEKNDIHLKALFHNLQETNKKGKKLVLNTSSSIHAISIEKIVRCESEDSYTTFFLEDGKKITVAKQLKEYDNLLTKYGFVRSHKSHLVNLIHLDFFNKSKNVLILFNKEKIPVSVRKKETILNEIKKLQTI